MLLITATNSIDFTGNKDMDKSVIQASLASSVFAEISCLSLFNRIINIYPKSIEFTDSSYGINASIHISMRHNSPY